MRFVINCLVFQIFDCFFGSVFRFTEIVRLVGCYHKVLPGGDYGFAWIPHGTNAKDLEYLVDLVGMTPMEALISATRYGGEIMGRPGELGQIKPGYLADMLLIDGDPVANIRILQDRERILAVMKDGSFHRSPDMQAERGRVAI